VSATSLDVGMEFEISGDSCTPGFVATLLIDQTLDEPPPSNVAVLQQSVEGPTGRPVAGPDGHWSIAATVPLVAQGAALLEAGCAPDNVPTSALAFRYENIPLLVKAAAQVRVSPGTVVAPGTTLTVSSATPCPSPAIPTAILVDSVTKAVLSPSGYGTPAAEWPVALTVATTAPPGVYAVESSCFQRDGPPAGVYEPVLVTVT
jgi:hypothetical protein